MQNEIQLFIQDGKAMVSSRVVAKDFGKRPSEVNRKIKTLIEELGCVQNCTDLFVESAYLDSQGKEQTEYLLTRDGFSLLVMGFTGKEALQWKLKYIEAFNKMEEMIKKQQKLTPMQECALTILDDNADGVERVLALETFKKLSIQEGVKVGYSQGLKQLCKDGIVTIPEIMNYIHELYADKFVYASDIASTEWSRYLKHMGYLHTVHFKRKSGFGMEDKPVYQPTKMFENVFVEQGMAIIREIDNRGKVEIKYTIELDKFLQTESFVETFFAFLDNKYTKFDKSIVSEEMSA